MLEHKSLGVDKVSVTELAAKVSAKGHLTRLISKNCMHSTNTQILLYCVHDKI